MTPDTPHVTTPRRGRLTLIAILLVFFGTLVVAGVLRFADIHPSATKQKGELLDPYTDLRQELLRDTKGAPYPWNPIARTWRIVIPAPADCGDACVGRAHDVAVVWQVLGQEADRADVLWWCATSQCAWPKDVPAPGTLRLIQPGPARQKLPRLDAGGGVPVYVVDPNGFVVLRYAPTADLAGLREDLTRLLKLQ